MEETINAGFMLPALTLRHNAYQREHFCDGSSGHTRASFGLVLKGRTRLVTGRTALELPSGSFFYLPVGLSYRSNWCGEPDIEYIMLHFTPPEGLPAFLPARLDALAEAASRTVPEIERLLKKTPEDQLRAISDFYALFAAALPYLTPDQADEGSLTLGRAVKYIREHVSDAFSVPQLAQECCISPSRLHHLFKENLNTTPVGYRNELRLLLASRMLRQEDVTTEAILAATGFSSAVYFREQFKRYYGMTPTEYRRTVTGR